MSKNIDDAIAAVRSELASGGTSSGTGNAGSGGSQGVSSGGGSYDKQIASFRDAYNRGINSGLSDSAARASARGQMQAQTRPSAANRTYTELAEANKRGRSSTSWARQSYLEKVQGKSRNQLVTQGKTAAENKGTALDRRMAELQEELDNAIRYGTDVSGYITDPLSASLYGGTTPYEGRSEAQIRQEIKDVQKQMRDNQKVQASFNAYNEMLQDAAGMEQARREQQAAGVSGLDWYDSAKAHLDQIQQQLDAAYAQRQQASAAEMQGMVGGMGVTIEQQLLQGERDARAAQAEGEILRLTMEKQEAQRQLRYANAYRYADVDLSEEAVALGRATYEQQHQQWTQAYAAKQENTMGGAFGARDPYMGMTDHKGYKEPTEEWTEEQRSIYFSLLGDGSDATRADEYAINTNNFIQAQKNQQKAEKVGKSAGSGFLPGLGHTAASIGAGLLSGGEFIADVMEYSQRGVIMEKPFGLSDYSTSVQGAISDTLNKKYGTIDGDGVLGGKGVGDVYQVATSIGQSWAAMALTGGSSALVSAMYFGQSAKSTLDEQLAMGRDPKTAIAMGTMAGVAEVLGETMSLENIKGLVQGSGRSVVVDILRSAGIEASEEGMTTLINTFADAIVNGSESDYYTALESYISQGMSYEDAQRKAGKDWLNGIAFDMLAGGVSGGVSGGVVAPAVRSAQGAVTKFSGDSQSLIAKGMEYEGSKAAELAAKYGAQLEGRGTKAEGKDARLAEEITRWEKLKESGTVNDRRMADREIARLQAQQSRNIARAEGLSVRQADKLSREISRAGESRNREKVQASVEEQLRAAGLNRETAELAASGIWKSANGKLMTKEESRAMRTNRLGVQLRDELREVVTEGAVDVERITEDSPEWLRNLETSDSAMELLEAAYPEQMQQLRQAAEDGKREYVQELAEGQGEHADAIVQMFDPKNQTALDYVTAMDTAMNIEAANVSDRAAWEKSESVQYLTEQQRDYAWEQGQKQRRAAQEKAQSRQKEIDSRKEKAPQNAKKPAQKKDGKQGKKSGKVRSQGVEIEGKKYKAGDLKKISKAERRVLDRLSAATGVDIVFFETEAGESGRFEGANGFYRDGVVYLDINAGASNVHQRSAVLLTAAHEFTHFIRENSPAQYEALKEFITERMLADGREFAAMVRGKMNQIVDGKKLSHEDAVEEVIADACEMVFSDSKSVEALRQKDKGLWESVVNWMQEFLADIREAFAGVEARHESAKAMNDYLSELAERFGVALAEASEKAAEVNHSESIVKYSVEEAREMENEGIIISSGPSALVQERGLSYILASNIDKLTDMSPVKHLSGNEFNDRSKKLSEQITEYFSSFGNYVTRKKFGKVHFGDYGVGGILNHRPLNRAKAVTIAAAPYVVMHGKQINYSDNWKNRGYESYTFAAPVKIGKETIYVAAVVDVRSENEFYLNECVDSKGNYIRIDAAPSAYSKSGVTKDGITGTAEDATSSMDSIRSSNENVKQKFSMRDEVEQTTDEVARDITTQIEELYYDAYEAWGIRVDNYDYSIGDTVNNSHELFQDPEYDDEGNLVYPEGEGYYKGFYDAGELDGTSTVGIRTDSISGIETRVKKALEQARSYMFHENNFLYLISGDGAYAGHDAGESIITSPVVQKKYVANADGTFREIKSSVKTDFSRRDSTEGLTKEEAKEQARAYTKLKARAAKLEKQVKELKRELSKKPGKRVRPEDVRKLARELVQDYGSKANVDKVAELLQELGNRLVSGEELYWDDLMELAQSAAYEVLFDAVAYEDSREAYGDADGIAKDIRGRRFKLSESELKGLPEGFRKMYSGKLHMGTKEGTSVDAAYAELQESHGKGLFPDTLAAEDMMAVIADVYDRVTAKPTAYNPFQRNMNEAVNHVALDIMDTMLSEDIRQSPPTAMEKAEAKLQDEKRKRREALDKQKRDSEARIRDIRQQEKARRQEAVNRERAKKWEKVQTLRDYYRAKEEIASAKRKESAAVKKYRARVYEHADTLMRWINNNSQKEHVPESLKEPLIELLNEIDFRSKSNVEKGVNTRADQKYRDALSRLNTVLQNQRQWQRGEGGQAETNGFLDLPDDIFQAIAQHAETVRLAFEDSKLLDLSDPVSMMNSGQLQDLALILGTLETSIRQINQYHTASRFADVEAAARESMQDMRELGAAASVSRAADKAGDIAFWRNATPYYAFKRFGVAGMERFKKVMDGWGKMAMNIREVIAFTERTYNAKEVKNWEETVKTIELSSGRKVQMTVAQMMGLYCLSKREQGRLHLFAGGMRIADIDSKGRVIKQVESAQLTPSDVAEITDRLTERQRAVADKLQEFMVGRCADWANEVSMARFGYRQADDPNYYPIDTDPNSRPLNDPKAKETDLFRLINMASMKSVNPNANNAAVIHSIFDVFAAHASDMAKYNALALPLIDMMKWYNFRERSSVEVEDGGETITQLKDNSVQQAIELAFGKQAQSYFMNFMKDMNGIREGGRNEQVLKGLVGKYKAAAVGANIRVALQQPTAIIRAAYMINAKYLTQGAAMSGGVKEALKYSGLAVWKDLGFFDVNINRGTRDLAKGSATLGDRVREKGMKLAEWGDKITWGAIWNAAKLEIMEKNPGLQGEELMQATASRFDDIIIATQVMDSTITRSELMRSGNLTMAELTSFMSEPTVTYNVLMDAAMDYHLEKRRSGSAAKALKKTGGQMFRALSVFVVGAAVTSLAAAIADAMRDDDEYETFMEQWLEHTWENFKDNVNPFGLIPIGRDVWDITANYFKTGKVSAPTSMMWEPFVNIGKGLSSAWDAYQLLLDPEAEVREPNRTQWGRLYNALQGLSSITGLPAAGFLREVKALWNVSGAVITGKTLKFYDIGAKATIRTAVQEGKLSEDEAIEKLIAAGEYENGDDAYWQVQTWLNADVEGWNKMYDLHAAIAKGDKAAWEKAAEVLTDHGYSMHKLRNETVNQVGRLVCDESGQKLSRAKAKDILKTMGGMTQMEADHQWDEWQMKLSTGIYLKDLQDEFVAGNVGEARAVQWLIKYDHQRKLDAAARVQEWKMEKETGIPYSRLRDAYLHKELSRDKLVTYLQRYGGKTAEEAEAKALHFDAAIKYGVQMGSSEYGILDAYLEGYLTRDVAKEIMIFFDGKTEEEAEEYMSQYDFEKETGYAWKSGDGVQTAIEAGEMDWQEGVEWFRKASPSTHGSPEVAEELMQVVDWKINVPGADKINRDAVKKWDRYDYHITNRGMGKADFAFAWKLYMNSESQYDSMGNKVKEKAEVFFDKLYKLYQSGEYTLEEINGLSRAIYGRKYISLYRKW